MELKCKCKLQKVYLLSYDKFRIPLKIYLENFALEISKLKFSKN